MSSTTKKRTHNDLTYFEKQRDLLISEISISMDSILNNLNSLNRSIESSIQVGQEFKSVSDLWSNFYDGLNQIEELRLKNQQTAEDNDEEINDKDSQNEQESNNNNDIEKDQNQESENVQGESGEVLNKELTKDNDGDFNVEN